MTVNSQTKNFWVYFNTNKPEKALAYVPKIEKHYEDWAMKNGSDPEEAKRVFMQSMQYAIKQAKELVKEKEMELLK